MKYIAKKCRWRLSNIQQSYDGHMDEMLKELDELERLAEIGRATEKAFKHGVFMVIASNGLTVEVEITTVKELIAWAESEAE